MATNGSEQPKVFDKRTVKWYIRQKAFQNEEYEHYLSELPDVQDKSLGMSTVQPERDNVFKSVPGKGEEPIEKAGE